MQGLFRILGLYAYISLLHSHLNLLIHPSILTSSIQSFIYFMAGDCTMVISAKAGYSTMEDPLPNSHHDTLYRLRFFSK